VPLFVPAPPFLAIAESMAVGIFMGEETEKRKKE
jgi:hypothetical protein